MNRIRYYWSIIGLVFLAFVFEVFEVWNYWYIWIILLLGEIIHFYRRRYLGLPPLVKLFNSKSIKEGLQKRCN